MLTTLLSALLLSVGELSCPIMGGAANEKGGYSDYNGLRVYYCCGGCQGAFEKDPAKALDKAAKGGKTVGVFLFDPVTRQRVSAEKSKGTSDFGGVRYHFSSTANKASFDKEPKKYASLPAKEALYCPNGKEAIESYAAASGYVDHKGVRYYMCCAGCDAGFIKNADKLSEGAKGYVKAPGIATEKKKD